MKLSIALAAAFTGSAAAVYAPPQPKDGQDLVSLWKEASAEAVFMQNEITLKRTVEQCKEDCNLAKEAGEDINRARCQRNCEQLDDQGVLNDDDDDTDRNNRNGRSQARACDQCCAFGDTGDIPGRRQERCLQGADCPDDFCVDWGNDDNRSNRRPAATEFYQGMCGNDVDDDNNWVDNFCVDMFANSSPRTNLNICNDSNTNQIDDFCDWLDVNNKSFSNRDYFLGMCDGPNRQDRNFCRDIDNELCGRNGNQLSNTQKDLCDWLIDDDSSSKKAEAAASLSKFAPMLRAIGKN